MGKKAVVYTWNLQVQGKAKLLSIYVKKDGLR